MSPLRIWGNWFADERAISRNKCNKGVAKGLPNLGSALQRGISPGTCEIFRDFSGAQLHNRERLMIF